MVDELYDRSYQSGRAELHDGIHAGLLRLRDSITQTFELLHRIQFAAPWARDERRKDIGCA